MARCNPILAMLLTTLSVGAAEQPLVAVVHLAALGVDSGSVAVVEDAIASELVETRKVRVLEREQMDRILREQGFQQSGACDQGNCSVEIGKLLAVDEILTGSLGKVGESYSLTLRLVNVGSGEVVNSVTRSKSGKIDAVLTDLLPTVVGQLLAPPGQGNPTPPVVATNASAPEQAPAQSKQSKTAVWPWVIGGTVVAGAGVAALLLLDKPGGSSNPATTGTSSVGIVLP
ncbi:MAG TPA: CsgG/HfaB family protein [Fibrobacteria bacterium]|nr:CsgG/HfaB family protein [Fibrobacteria bacterium]